MATCPNCGVRSREVDDAIWVSPVLEARPIGTFSVAGATPKVSATFTLRMYCRCGWSIAGWLEDETFVGQASTQVFPQEDDQHD